MRVFRQWISNRRSQPVPGCRSLASESLHSEDAGVVIRCVLGLLFLMNISGCGQATDGESGEQIPEIPLAEILENEPDRQPDATSALKRQEPASEIPADAPTGSLEFALRVGDRFPLRKTIRQTLTQQTDQGPAVSSSTLTMLFAISVDAEDAGRKRLGVRYQSIQYEHDLLGEKLQYDSQSPPAAMSEDLLLYHGMVDNGFSFWLSTDNRIMEVIGFQDFLKRCVRHAPPHRQQKLIDRVLAGAEDEGFANFVDDSIGLLPYRADAVGRETEVREGENWTRERRLLHPLPMTIRTNYRVNSLNGEVAQLAIIGTIEPVQVAPVTSINGLPQAGLESALSLQAGHLVGHCTIDRLTGLPLRSHVERHLQLQVGLPNQRPTLQQKSVVTSIEAFPSHGTVFSKTPAVPSSPPPAATRPREVVRTEALEQPGSGVIKADFEQPADRSRQP